MRSVCRVSLLIFSLLLAVLLAATYAGDTYEAFLNDRLQIETSYVVTDGDGSPNNYYTSDYATQDALYEAKIAQIRETVREGAVLLKNEGNALPLQAAREKDISIFGRSSTEMIQGIAGGAAIVPGVSDPLTEVLASVGLVVNPVLYSFYEEADGYAYKYSGSTISVGEVPVSEYTQAVKDSYAEYDDAALVVISRSKGEGADFSLDPADVEDGDGEHYGLALQNN